MSAASGFPTEVHGTIARSTAWLSAASVMVRGLNLLRMLVLARLLAPSDFGLFGLAVAIIGLGMIVGDMGAGAYLLYRSRADEAGMSAAFWLNVGLACVLAAALAVSGQLAASFYKNDSLAAIVAALALGAWFTILGFFPRDLLRTRSRFRVLGVVDICAAGVSFSTAVVLATLHIGVWALVWSAVLYQVVATLAWQIASGWWPRTIPSLASFRLVFNFAGWYTGSVVAWYLVTIVDNLLVGKLLGVSALGFYVLAYNLALVPLMLILTPFGTVIFPKLAGVENHDTAFWDFYEKSSRFIATLGIPLCAAMAVAAPDLVGLFGSKWMPAVVPLQILLAYAAVRLFIVDSYNALGRFRTSFAAGVVTLLVEMAAIAALTPRLGLSGAALAVLVVVGGSHIAGLVICGAAPALARRVRNSWRLAALSGLAAAAGLAIQHIMPRVALQLPYAAFAGGLVLLAFAYGMRTYLRTVWSDIRSVGALTGG